MCRSFEAAIGDYISRHGLLRGVRCLGVSVSGGADSVCLLRVLHGMGIALVAVHCNFGLRGEESERDQRFVEGLCSDMGVQLAIRRFSGLPEEAKSSGESIEMICRRKRLLFYDELFDRDVCDAIALAHHKDDNIETFFLNALRGSGITGLAAMPPKLGNRIVRPLLCVTRQQILGYLQSIGQDFVTDSTNLTGDYRRNKLRNDVLPGLYEHFANARETLATTISNMADADALLSELVEKAETHICGNSSLHSPDDDSDAMVIDTQRLADYDNAATLLYEMLRPCGFNRTQTDGIYAASVAARPGRYVASTSHEASVEAKRIVVQRLGGDELDQTEYEITLDGTAITSPLRISVQKPCVPFTAAMCDGSSTVAFSSSLLECRRVVLRHWRRGDRFRPFGMRGTKLLSDLFADLKMGLFAKRKVWVMEADGEIIWVLGIRAANAFVVKPLSCDYVLLTCK